MRFYHFKIWCFIYLLCPIYEIFNAAPSNGFNIQKRVWLFRLIWRCQCIKGCATIPINAHLSCALSHDSEKKYLDLYTEKNWCLLLNYEWKSVMRLLFTWMNFWGIHQNMFYLFLWQLKRLNILLNKQIKYFCQNC